MQLSEIRSRLYGYRQLRKLAGPLVQRYRGDLLRHDRKALFDRPTGEFIHWTRLSGTHLVELLPADSYPPAGTQVPYLFGFMDRKGLLDSVYQQAQYFADNPEVRLVLHRINGVWWEISSHEAVQLVQRYQQRVEAEWKTYGQESRGAGRQAHGYQGRWLWS